MEKHSCCLLVSLQTAAPGQGACSFFVLLHLSTLLPQPPPRPHTPCQISRMGVFEERLSTGQWWGPQSKGKEQPVEDWAGRRGMSPLPGGAESLGSYTQEGSSSLPPG